MTDIKYQARLQVLSQWATEAAGQGHLVPRIADLESISAARTVEAPGVSREALEPWLPTIQWLLKQAAFGVVDAHVQLPDELSRPVGGPKFSSTFHTLKGRPARMPPTRPRRRRWK